MAVKSKGQGQGGTPTSVLLEGIAAALSDLHRELMLKIDEQALEIGALRARLRNLEKPE